MHRHNCLICGKEFLAVKKKRITCGQVCQGKLAGTSRSKRICACGKPASKKGFCAECSLDRKRRSRREHYYRHREAILEQRHIQYVESAEVRARSRLVNAKVRFNGLRLERLRLDKFTCQHCGTKEKLVVHHHEKVAGKHRKDQESNIENLLTLCRKCHINHHRSLGDLNQGYSRLAVQQSHLPRAGAKSENPSVS